MKKRFLIILCNLFCIVLIAQNDGNIDLSFNTQGWFGQSGVAKTIAIQPDGKILIGGDFHYCKGIVANNIIRLNIDGTKDNSFVTGSGFNSSISSLTIQPDGKIIAGGAFTTFNGFAVNGMIRINTNGTIDTSFNTSMLFYNIEKIILQSDGKILVGGSPLSGTNKPCIIRLENNGSIDSTFNPGQILYKVKTIVIQPDGKIIVGGDALSGSNTKNIFRLNTDGTIDTPFNNGNTFGGSVNSIALQIDGKLIICGEQFHTYNGTVFKGIIRLNTDGSVDNSLTSGLGFDNVVYTLALQSDGKIIVGGKFSSFNGIEENSILRLNSDGTKDTSFTTGKGFDFSVYDLSILPNGKFYVGGDFSNYNTTTADCIIRLDSNGIIDNSFNTGNVTTINTSLTALFSQEDGKVLVGGGFTRYNENLNGHIIRLNSNATVDNGFNTGVGFVSAKGLNAWVYSFAVQADKKIIVGGSFSSYNGVPVKNIVRLNIDGTLDTTFSNSINFNYGVYTIALQTDGKIIVGGSSINDPNANNLVRLNVDGTIDSSFKSISKFDFDVEKVIIKPNGKIIVGGSFTSFNGVLANGIMQLNADGSIDNSFVSGTGFENGSIFSLLLQTDGKIIVTGYFLSYNGTATKHIVRLNTDGTIDLTFNTGSGFNKYTWAALIQSDNKLIIGGSFTSYNGSNSNRMIRLNTDGTVDSSFDIGTGFDTNVYSLTNTLNGKIIAIGAFASYKGAQAKRIIRLTTSNSLFVDEFSKHEFSIYPNPVNTLLNFNSNFDLKSFEIHDLNGKKVLSSKITTNQIDVSNLPPSVYIIKIQTNEGVITKKFIVD